MTIRHDPAAPIEPLTPEERDWAARLAMIGPHDGPPSALDTKILAAAHAAVAQRPHRHSQRRRWPTLVGAAASLVIVVGLAWQLQPLLRSRPSLSEGPVASAPMAASEGALSDDVLAAADPIAQAAVSSPPPPPAESAPKSLRPPQAVANSRRVATPTSAPPSAEFGDDAIPPYTDYAGMAAARQAASQSAAKEATGRIATDERRSRAAPASPQAFPTTRTDADEATAMPAPPAPPTPPAAPAAIGASGALAPTHDASARKAAAPPPPSAAAEQDNTTLDRIEVTGSRIAKTFPPVREDVRLDAAAWLQRIRDRRDADDLEDARESLALFRQHHPRVRLPADLAQLGR